MGVAFYLVTIITLVTLLIVKHFKNRFNYWKNKGVPQITPTFPFGNIGEVIAVRKNVGQKIKEMYDLFKAAGHRFGGVYFFDRTAFLVLSPDLVKNVLTKDCAYFDDRGIHYDEIKDPLSAHLFSLNGSKWKNLRAKFSPAFTPGKLKYMFDTFSVCGGQMMEVLSQMEKSDKEVEMKDILARFTTDVIGSCAFGIDCNTLKHPNTKFHVMGRRAFTQTIGDIVKVVVIKRFPDFARMFGMGIFASSVTRFFKDVVTETMSYREANNVSRNDFFQLLIQLKQNGRVEEDPDQTKPINLPPGTTLTLNEAAAQAFIFFIAGFETTATTMTFALYEMAVNSYIQKRARQEVVRAFEKYGNQICYDAVMEMPYLDLVVLETLRKHPPAPIYLRKCTEDYTVPETNIIIEKGTVVLVPVIGLHKDPEYFPEPDEFDPERFNEENKYNIIDHTYIPFGEGPRMCIGQRFAMAQIKVGLSLILKNFSFTLNEKTGLPLRMEKKGIITTPINGIWINLKAN